MNPTTEFIEKRKEHRLPYYEKVIYTTSKVSYTAYAANFSRGGLFVTTQNPLPLDTEVMISFCLPNHENSFCYKGKVAHIVFDKQRCEIENGMGLRFLELSNEQREVLSDHILTDQKYYSELKQVLEQPTPNLRDIDRYLVRFSFMKGYDLLRLRYRVNRICSIFEGAPTSNVVTLFPEKSVANG